MTRTHVITTEEFGQPLTPEDLERRRKFQQVLRLPSDIDELIRLRERLSKKGRPIPAEVKEAIEFHEAEKARWRAEAKERRESTDVTQEQFETWIEGLPVRRQIDLRAGREIMLRHEFRQPAKSLARWEKSLRSLTRSPGPRKEWLARVAQLRAELRQRLLASQPTWERPAAVEKALELAHAAVARVDAASTKLRQTRTDVSLLGYELRDKTVDGTAEEDIAVIRAQLRAEKKRAAERSDAVEAAAEEARQPINDFRAAERQAVALLKHRQADYEAKIHSRIAAARAELEEAEAQLEDWNDTEAERAAGLPNPNRTASDLQAVVDRALEAALDTSA